MKRFLIFFSCILFFVPLQAQIVISSAQEAIDLGLTKSEQLQYLELQMNYELQAARLDFGSFLPSIGISYGEKDLVVEKSGDSRKKDLQFTVTQLLFDGGVSYNLYELNRIRSLYKYQELEIEKQKIKIHILDMYYEIVMLKKKLDIQNNIINLGEKNLEIIKKEHALGLTLELDLLEYEISLFKIYQEKKQLEDALQKSMRDFKRTLGLSPESELHITETHEIPFIKNCTLIGKKDYFINQAKNHNYQLKLNELELLYSKKQNGFLQKNFFPKIYFESSITFSGTDFPLRQPDYNFGLKFNFSQNTPVPVTFSSTGTVKENALTALNSFATVNLNPDFTFFIREKLGKIAVMQQEMQKIDSEEELYKNIEDLLIYHDSLLQDLSYMKMILDVYSQKIKILETGVKNGTVNGLDVFKALNEEATQKIDFYEKQIEICMVVRNIELICGIPLGGLYDL
ncbi:MAG: TolC family protein [Candidatus Treponema excrementipullorum]|nr:TolC family protein [Spirochaetia bacterium]MCI7590164.1 TolC family protein [Spirochaetia bacterium]MDD7011907.1 TolC family protein [Candidatus Treponema excrementipullorum]MDY4706932.1 TolC family protein [Candidatus Treponema excrementipullorum]